VRRRTLKAEEEALWTAFVRDIAPLGRKQSALESARPAPAEPTGTPARAPIPKARRILIPQGKIPPPVRLVRAAPGVTVGLRLPGVDDTSWKALEGGKMRTQRTLDLHGHAAQAAFLRLQTFLQSCAADGVRCVEIITGLGSGEEGGVIRRELPLWLGRADLRPLVLAVVHPHAANRGAVRILLRRRKR
jgi:DNA-nicking Smr family endonuclease